MLELIPVIEFETSRFATKKRALPSGSRKENPDGWYCYWVECLADSGITGLLPVEKSSFVPVEDLRDFNILKIFLRVWFEDMGSEPDLDQVDTIGGGFILRSQGKVVIWPECCGDLSNLANWKLAALHRDKHPIEVWIGHPSVYVYYDGRELVFEGGQIYDFPGGRYSVNPDELYKAVISAEQKVAEFRTRLEPVLNVFFPSALVKRTSEILVYGHN